mmetsp:Transcript_5220/g.11140  ORF Transcript_5220/g.11140 Transcript_5220/m.11140 type:complete len:388 (+) Transcript_5220:216-1379(+)
MTVMLSHPLPTPTVSGARQKSQMSSQICLRDFLPILSRTKVTASWFVITSQIPSQARITNSSSLWSLQEKISGKAVTACCSGVRSLLCLYSMSPRARLRLSEPLTRPSVTKPPALWILSASSASCGLWSRDMATAWPPREKTHRLSPALATTISSLTMTATTAVQPALGPPLLARFSYMKVSAPPPTPPPVTASTMVSTASSSAMAPPSPPAPAPLAFLFRPCLMPIKSCLNCACETGTLSPSPAESRVPSRLGFFASSISSAELESFFISSSMFRYASTSDLATSPSSRPLVPFQTSRRCREQKLATSRPPWPSKTPYTPVASPTSASRHARCASSMSMRQPVSQKPIKGTNATRKRGWGRVRRDTHGATERDAKEKTRAKEARVS